MLTVDCSERFDTEQFTPKIRIGNICDGCLPVTKIETYQ